MNKATIIISLAIALILGLFATPALSQPIANIRVEGYSPQEIHDMGWATPRSTGLSVVGVGQVVYLVGSANTGTVMSYAWSLTNKPAGSAATLDSAATRQTTLVSDVEGKYTVSLVVMTADGTSEPAEVTVTAAKFVGVGGYDGLPTAPKQCALGCHGGNVTQWKETGHSSMLTRAVDGLVSDHYNESCIECHSVGYDDWPTAVNDGFDDVQTELGWTLPDTLQPGNWDDMKANYEKLAQRANIQCESCHGPGSQHNVTGPDKTSIAMSIDEASCGYCHDEGAYHVKSAQWKLSVHGNPTTDRSNTASCAPCHSGWGFIDRIDPDAAYPRPTLGVNQVTCAVCHDPHSAANEYQVRTTADVTLENGEVITAGELGKLCMNCHMAREDAETYATEWHSRFGPHHGPQADMLAGTNAIDFGKNLPSSNHRFVVENGCVGCHMSPTPGAGESGHNLVGEHTFTMEAMDNGVTVDNVSACRNCHGSIDSFADIRAKEDYDGDGNLESAQEEVHGLLDELGKKLPPLGDPAVAIETNPTVDPNYTPVQLFAAYNYMFILEDKSWGVHNFQYTINLLKSSIEALAAGDAGAGMITDISDVPNDQGKQVRVAWMKFPGDGVTANPIMRYSLWRRVDDNMPGVAATEVGSKEAMFALASKDNVGRRFSITQEGSWDFVAEIPAAGHAFYNAVAPTIFDSTAAGMHWSFFFVAGHAAQGQYFESAPDSGYSVDNLIPAPPANIELAVTGGGVRMTWDDPVDEDFRYFAIYRSTTSGFDPKDTEPIAELSETQFTDMEATSGTYYYRLSTFDFSGNESNYSAELVAIITSVDGRSNVPTVYALEQNFPNPFNPQTAISYQLPDAGHVRLVIFNALGNEVRNLVDATRAAGSYTAIWDGRDNAGQIVPSGLYFYRFESGSFNAMKKMIMMK